MARQVRAGIQETRTVELRLDWLRSNAERRRFLTWLGRQRFKKTIFLATCRRRAAGGELTGSIEDELRWLVEARKAGCTWCDVAIESLRELPLAEIRRRGVPAKVLLSLHDFKKTPKLPGAIQKLNRAGADAIKIAANTRTISESVRLLRLPKRSGSVVSVAMGEVGLPARLLALREGSALAYAPVGPATAPGQVRLHDLKHLYRAHKLSMRTEVFGVIGDPIHHSLSPLLHNTGFIAARRDAVYLPFLVHNLRDFLRAIPDFGLRGFSVTIPHKQTILKYLADCDPLAAEIGAVNTVVVRRDGKLIGSNTDYIGVLMALEKKMKLRGSRVLLFGAGGSARAAAFALAKAGAHVSVCARRDTAARNLARAVDGDAIPRKALRSESFNAIINTTPVGMYPHDNVSPLTVHELRCDLVMDLIYRPLETRLLRLARNSGIATVSGVDMFLAQGFAQWEIWTKSKPPMAAMRRAVIAKLRQEERSR